MSLIAFRAFSGAASQPRDASPAVLVQRGCVALGAPGACFGRREHSSPGLLAAISPTSGAAPSTYGGGQTWVSRHPRRGPPSPSARGWRESGPRPFPGRSPRLSGAGRIRSRERLCTRVGVRERRGKRHRSRVCDDRIGGLEPGRENHSCRACASTPLLIEAAWSRMTDRRESMPSCQLNRRA